MFFNKNDRIHQTMRRVAEKLETAGIPYAIVGGMAVNAHRHERTTKDVDFLLTSEGLTSFIGRFVSADFERVAGHPRRFIDRSNGVTFDILLTGLFPGNGKPGPISYPDPMAVSEIINDARVLRLSTLIELKLAAGRHKDLGDVIELIRVHDLNEDFASNLAPSVHADFIECVEDRRREDEYESRQDQEFKKKENSEFPPSP
jgi:hypothetical protein